MYPEPPLRWSAGVPEETRVISKPPLSFVLTGEPRTVKTTKNTHRKRLNSSVNTTKHDASYLYPVFHPSSCGKQPGCSGHQSPAERLRNQYVGCSSQGLMSLTSIISPFFTNLRERSHCKPNPELFHNFDQLLPTVPRLYRQEGQKLSSALKPGLNREPPACSLQFTETGPGPELRKPGRHRSNYNQQDRRVNTIRRLAGNLHGSREKPGRHRLAASSRPV